MALKGRKIEFNHIDPKTTVAPLKRMNFVLTEAGVSYIKPHLFAKAKGVESTKEYNFEKYDYISEEADFTSYLNTPVIDNLIFPSGSYFNLDQNPSTDEPITFEAIRIDAVIITVSQAKNIVTTAINNQKGTIKEYFSDGDFVINISGLIIGETSADTGGKLAMKNIGNVYPEIDVKRMVNICKVPYPINIESIYLNDIFGINKVVIKDSNFPQREGVRNAQYFELSMLSDYDIDLNQVPQ